MPAAVYLGPVGASKVTCNAIPHENKMRPLEQRGGRRAHCGRLNNRDGRDSFLCALALPPLMPDIAGPPPFPLQPPSAAIVTRIGVNNQ